MSFIKQISVYRGLFVKDPVFWDAIRPQQLRRSNPSVFQNLIEIDLCRMKELFCMLVLCGWKKLHRLMVFQTLLSLPPLAELI